MKHIQTFESFINEGFFVDNPEEKIKEIVLRVLREMGYAKRERFITVDSRYSGGMYQIFLNGEHLAMFLKYTVERDQPSDEIENKFKKVISAEPKKFGL